MLGKIPAWKTTSRNMEVPIVTGAAALYENTAENRRWIENEFTYVDAFGKPVVL